MKTANPLDKAYLKECFDYDAESGCLIWRQRPLHHFKNADAMVAWNAKLGGKFAGYKTYRLNGQPRSISLHLTAKGGKLRLTAHRIIAAMLDMDISGTVDHRNGDPFDNKPLNLRSATQLQNVRNSGITIKNGKPRALPKGVRRNGPGYCAQITVNYQQIYLGQYKTPLAASVAYQAAAKKHFGEFART